MPKRGGSRGKHSLGSTDTLAVSRKGDKFTIAQKNAVGRYIQLDVDDIFDLAEILDDVCDRIEDEGQTRIK